MPVDGLPALSSAVQLEMELRMTPIAGGSEFFRLEVLMTEDVPTVKVVGEVGIPDGEAFARDLKNTVAQLSSNRILLDLRELWYVDGVGLTALLEELRRWKDRALDIAILGEPGFRQLLLWLEVEQVAAILTSDDDLAQWLRA